MFELIPIGDRFAVCRLPPTELWPTWPSGEFISMSRTGDELSIVCDERCVPPGVQAERGWACLRIAGNMDFSLVGVVAGITSVIAKANIGVFVVSTYDTDYLLVKAENLQATIDALRSDGYSITSGAGNRQNE